MEQKADKIFSLEAPVAPIRPLSTSSDVAPIRPPSTSSDVDDDIIVSNTRSPEEKLGGLRGGSLVQAMTRATYTLAPAAALLATAATIMKRGKKGSRKKAHKKRSVKRRK
jgi:hypothetical protein